MIAVKDDVDYIATIDNLRTLARKTQDELLNPAVGEDARNARFDETYGTVKKRKNRSIYASMSTLGTLAIKSAYRYYKSSDATKYQIVAYNTFLKKGNDSSGAFTNIQTGLTAGKRFTWQTIQGVAYGFNGVDANQAYTGGAALCETMGVPVPATVPTVATSATGITGTYKYKVTYELDGYQEGNASTASDEVTPSNEQVDLTAIPLSANSRCTARNLYRTLDGGTIYYFLARIADNTTETYTDTTADAGLDTTIPAPSDYSAPASYKYSCIHKSRVWLARNATHKSRLIFSDIRDGTSYPDVFPALNYYDILKDNGEEVTFIGEDNFGQLIIMKPSAVVKINTDTDDPVGYSGMGSVISTSGCIAPYSVAKTSLGIIYLSRFGEFRKRLMVWTGSGVQPVFEELEPILSAVFDTYLENIVGHYHNGSYHLAYPDGVAYNNKVLIIDLMTGSWVIDDKNVECFCSWNGSADWGELYTGSSDTTGFLRREDTDASTASNLIIDLKSELDAGTVDAACETGGTESAPTLKLIKATLDAQVGAAVISTLTSAAISTYDSLDLNETVAPSCTYLSDIYEVNAKQFQFLYWSEVIGTGGYIRFWVRTGATEAACGNATWSPAYSNAYGSDLSALTASKWVQFRVKMYVKDTTNYAGTYLYCNDYVAKLTFGYGAIAETAIDMIYESSWLDFSWVHASLKRLRKRVKAVKIEFDRTVATGDLIFGYQINGSSSRTDITLPFSTWQSKGYALYRFPPTFFSNFKYRIENNDAEDLTIKKVHFLISPTPYTSLL